MLHSYSAEIHGSQLTWLGTPPPPLHHQRVLVVVDADTKQVRNTERSTYKVRDLAGRLQWQGDALAEQRQQRDAW